MSLWGKDPGGAAGLQLGLVTGALVLGAADAHRRGVAALRAEEDARTMDAWEAALSRSRASAAEARQVARSAVVRARELEAEVAALRRAVTSRDALIRRLSR